MHRSFLLPVILCLAFISCRKPLDNVEDYFPRVKTESVEVLQNGDVQLEGEIVSEGHAPIEYIGYCFDSLNVPDLLKNQVSAVVSGTKFTVVYPGYLFDPYKRYYFRSWAANDYGYAYGDIVQLDSISATPIVTPCSPTMNTVTIGGGQPTMTIYSVSAPEADLDSWLITAEATTGRYYLEFGSKPATGEYITSTNSSSSLGDKNVHVYFYYNMIVGSLKSGTKVYINQTGPDKWEITICDAPWTFDGYNASGFKMSLTSPL